MRLQKKDDDKTQERMGTRYLHLPQLWAVELRIPTHGSRATKLDALPGASLFTWHGKVSRLDR